MSPVYTPGSSARSARTGGAFVVTPRVPGVTLPALTLPAPPASPADAAEAADGYAREHARRLGVTAHGLARTAYAAVLHEVPGLHRADVIERLQGTDRRATLGAF